MLNRVIESAFQHRLLILLATAVLALAALVAVRSISLDVLPNLADTQVIVYTSYPGQAPQIVEDQVTYALSTVLRSVPRVRTVRGYSLFGESFIYVLFLDDTDVAWARTRVTEALSQLQSRLPSGVVPRLGPDATGVEWVYEYALRDPTGKHDLAELRALQDWVLRYELQSLPGVAEVAAIGGMVREYQVSVDPRQLSNFGITLADIESAIRRGNRETGGSVIEMAETEYMVRATGYVGGVADLENIPVRMSPGTPPVLLGNVADIRAGPELRRGVAELDGRGEVVGAVVVARQGYDVNQTIHAVKERLAALRRELPAGVEIVTAYDRSALIDRAVANLSTKLLEEFVIVAGVCLLFLTQLRSSVAALIVLPLGVLGALAIMAWQGIQVNIMSLGGIAISMGTMVDAAVVMLENAHRSLEGRELTARERIPLIARACGQVGPPLFVSMLIVALSFLPILVLDGEQGRLFAPLAYTKAYAMLVAALLSITIVPVLLTFTLTGPVRPTLRNPINRWCLALYRPLLSYVLRAPRTVVLLATGLVLLSLWPAARLETELMPDMDEGDLLYMPSTLPGISVDTARMLVQQTDRLIGEIPEVEQVFGKAGRADTATDPAPLEMLETLIRLKPRSQWRPGLTFEQLRAELDRKVQLPGLSNSWLPPIKARVDMLTTGMRATLGIKLTGASPRVLQETGARLQQALATLPGAASVYAERDTAGRYLQIDPDRRAAAKYGLNIDDVHEVVRTAVGGEVVGESVEGRRRFNIQLRYPRDWRDSIAKLRELPIVLPGGVQLVLGDVAAVHVVDGPARIRSEDARLSSWVYINLQARDVQAFVRAATAKIVAEQLVPATVQWHWSGEYEQWQRARAKLALAVPLTLAIVVFLLCLVFRRLSDVMLILGALPVALLGGVWLLALLDYRISVASVVGFIALAGIAAETGVLMLVYLNQAWQEKRVQQDGGVTAHDLHAAIIEGALLRLRPKLMTVACIIVGLLPIMFGDGAGSEVMRRIAAPMLGGMVSATFLTLLVVPALFLLLRSRELLSVMPQPR